LGPAGQHDPSLAAPFGSVLGLASLPDPTTLCLATRTTTIAFGRGDNALSCNSCQKTQ